MSERVLCTSLVESSKICHLRDLVHRMTMCAIFVREGVHDLEFLAKRKSTHIARSPYVSEAECKLLKLTIVYMHPSEVSLNLKTAKRLEVPDKVELG